MEIRKLSVGPSYKDAMIYAVDQKVLGSSHTIKRIKKQDNGWIALYIINDKSEIFLYKEFSPTVPVSIEYSIDI